MTKPETHRVMSTSRLDTPHVGHIATVAAYLSPDGRAGQVAITACGRAIRSFMLIDDMEQDCTDGSPFWRPCPACESESDDHA